MFLTSTRCAVKLRWNFLQSQVLIPLTLALTALGLSSKAAQALSFNFSPPPPTVNQQAYDGFVAAGNLWSNLFTDSVTVNLTIGFQSLGAGVLAQAGSSQQSFSYTQVRNALLGDRKSTDDFLAVANLPAIPGFNMLINRTSNNPNGSGSATPYLDNDGDANNTTITMTTANAKALGLRTANNTSTDASITFNSNFTFDFDRSNGISSNAFDFIGVAAHEIGHALGFISGVDRLDFKSQPSNGGPLPDDQLNDVTTLDLFRYSTLSRVQGAGVIDWTADNRDKYFSLDGGTTAIGDMSLPDFANGTTYGDGYQASHWKDNLGRGIMDPTFGNGELGVITELDNRGFDAIGWDRANASSIPTPAVLPGLIGLGLSLRRKLQVA